MEANKSEVRSQDHYDVVVLGGAFAGASVGLLLRRFHPSARVLIVERTEEFDRKVGEATVELSAQFITNVLGLYDSVSRNHLPKHGLRYWFGDGAEDLTLGEMSEVGPHDVPGLPSFQLDRAKFDSELLERAADSGVDVLRPAKVTSVDLDGAEKLVSIDVGGDIREVSARWVVDASGRQAFLGRRMGLIEQNAEHPTSAYWARWSGVADMDGAKDLTAPPLPWVAASRRLATNHFCGYGWWCWVIPLATGETSIGVVWDERLFQPDSTGSPREDYERFVRSCAGLRELVASAEMAKDDFRSYRNLSYGATRFMGDGWALVGDAGFFIDPFYSPGLDGACTSAYATATLIAKQLAGECSGAKLTAEIERHNGDFSRSYRRWFSALYQDKYEILGDAELTTAAFLLDTSLYYLGVVSAVFKDVDTFRNPVLGPDNRGAATAHFVLRFYNQRLVKLARARREFGIYGRRNRGSRFFPKPLHLGAGTIPALRSGLRIWLTAELDMAWRRLSTLWRRDKPSNAVGSPSPNPSAPAAESRA